MNGWLHWILGGFFTLLLGSFAYTYAVSTDVRRVPDLAERLSRIERKLDCVIAAQSNCWRIE